MASNHRFTKRIRDPDTDAGAARIVAAAAALVSRHATTPTILTVAACLHLLPVLVARGWPTVRAALDPVTKTMEVL